jgi:molybdopterin-biosynthesis enzyme MoeA-like protein
MLRLGERAAIAVVPDEIQLIADEVAYCARIFDFVVTSGGVGPTHDDITIEAVASFVRNSVWPETV